jgi:ParB family chromosome partitioning protein
MKNLEIKTENAIKTIVLSKLIVHPDNPNSMSDSTFRKLVRNIERTGLYEPIVVRPHPNKKEYFQIINGHHRVKALEQIGRKEADCVVWDVDDGETSILLTTLNRLAGSDTPAKKIELLKKLTERMGTAQLAKLLPQTAKQIERLTNLKLNSVPIKLNADSFAVPLVFFVTKQQQEIIENALSSVENQVSRIEMTKAQRRAGAITKLASQFMEGEKCRM